MLLLEVGPEAFADVSVDVDEGVGGRVSNRCRRVGERRNDPRQEPGDDQSLGAMSAKKWVLKTIASRLLINSFAPSRKSKHSF